MIVCLQVILLCVLGMALPSATPAMGTPRRAEAPAVAEVAIHADIELPSSHLRTSDMAELLAKLERTLAGGTTGVLPVVPESAGCATSGAPRGARASDDATRWCCVLQCRRQSGAQLLRYATPPPSGC